MDAKLEKLRGLVKNYPDFPKPGILFQDIFSLLQNPAAFRILKEVLVEHIRTNIDGIDVIVGLESRGFLIGSVLALELGVPFVPIRKPGKLPGELVRVSYTLEYGTDTFEMQKDSIQPGQRVLIIDDLLATGGSLKAACQLVADAGAVVICSLVVMELVDLNGRAKISSPVHSLLKF